MLYLVCSNVFLAPLRGSGGEASNLTEVSFYTSQDFYKSESGSIVNGLCVKNFYTWMKKSKAQKILFILDCCFAELFTEALYVEKGNFQWYISVRSYAFLLIQESILSESSRTL